MFGSADGKSELNQLMQRHCKRPLSKSDIEYTSSWFGHEVQAIVKLNCMDGQEYAGHLCPDVKSAERSAAEQALQANSLMVQPKGTSSSSKRPRPSLEEQQKRRRIAGELLSEVSSPKSELNSLIGKIAKKVLAKGDTLYVCNQIGGQFQATCQSYALPGEWACRAWAGELCSSRQKAEQSAAEEALKDLSADPELMAEAHRTNKTGKPWNKPDSNWGPTMNMTTFYTGEMYREAVSEDFVTGTVLEWQGKYGWIRPDVPVQHAFAKYRGGRIWVSRQDLSGAEELSEGQRVSFKVYEPRFELYD